MGDADPKKILLVEDEAIIAIHEASILKKHGYEVITVYNGTRAIEAVRKDAYDLILMDIDLGRGRMDGTECAESILQEYELPIIFLTSHAEKEMVDRVKGITRYGYIIKNAGEFVIIESITMALKLFEAYQQIKEKERQLELAMDAGDHAYWDLNLETKKTYFSPQYYRMLGYTPEELPMDLSTWENLLHPQDREQIIPRIFEKVNAAETFNEEFRLKTKEGRWKWIKGSGKSYYSNGQGAPRRIVGTHEDIDERKQAEIQQREYREFYESILETVHEGIWVSDRTDRIIYVNSAMVTIAGVSRERIVGKHVLKDFPSETIQEFGEYYAYVKNSLQKVAYEAEVTTPKGRATVQQGWLFPRIKDGEYNGIICTIQDITEKKRMLKDLQRSNEEKDFLMQELNHRIKNNLSLISSLINLKSSAVEGAVDLSDIRHQIDAIRIIHDKLYRTADILHVNVKEYIGELLQTIFSSFALQPVRIQNNIEEISIRTKDAVSLGLIMNEIAINAIKHGFSENITAVFSVSMREDDTQESYVLTVSNSGSPFPEHVHVEDPDTLGLRVITALVRQLGGTMKLRRTPCPEFLIKFPQQRLFNCLV